MSLCLRIVLLRSFPRVFLVSLNFFISCCERSNFLFVFGYHHFVTPGRSVVFVVAFFCHFAVFLVYICSSVSLYFALYGQFFDLFLEFLKRLFVLFLLLSGHFIVIVSFCGHFLLSLCLFLSNN